MPDQPSSKNFGFLSDYDPLLDDYALKAEWSAYSDPNTSLIKTRQFGELLAKSIASHAGMDCTANTFEETIGLLKRQRIVPRDIFSHLDQIRLYGNAAAHEHTREAMAALQSLICAFEIAKWFQVSVLKDSSFVPSPFKPLPKPEDATSELKAEIDFLRDEVARSQLATDASKSQIQELSERLEREAIVYQNALRQKIDELDARDREIVVLEQQSNARLKEVAAVAGSRAFQGFVERSKRSAQRLGQTNQDSLPLTQLRITTGERSSCCDAPLIVVQSMSGGFVTKNCIKCNFPLSLRKQEFFDLPICIVCGDCGQQAEPTMLYGNYGYRCQCGWTCELAALVAHYGDNEAKR